MQQDWQTQQMRQGIETERLRQQAQQQRVYVPPNVVRDSNGNKTISTTEASAPIITFLEAGGDALATMPGGTGTIYNPSTMAPTNQ